MITQYFDILPNRNSLRRHLFVTTNKMSSENDLHFLVAPKGKTVFNLDECDKIVFSQPENLSSDVMSFILTNWQNFMDLWNEAIDVNEFSDRIR